LPPKQRPGSPSSPRFQALQVASAGDRLYLLDERRALQVWKLQSATPERIEAEPLTQSDALPKKVQSLALRPDGRLLALGDASGKITLVDAARLAILGRLGPEPANPDDSEGPIFSLAFSPDGRRLAAGFQNGSIHVWSTGSSSNYYAHQFRLPGQSGRVFSMTFDSTGRKLAAGGVEPLVEVWDLDAFDADLRLLDLVD